MRFLDVMRVEFKCVDSPRIQLYPSGRAVDPLALAPEDVDIRDIAHALSGMPRFAAHVKRGAICCGQCGASIEDVAVYSVAQHSVHAAQLVFGVTYDPRAALCALLHDGSEAYLVDVPRPLKISPAFDEYRRIEAAVQSCVYERFGLVGDPPAIVKEIDDRLVVAEGYDLQAPGSLRPGASPLSFAIVPWSAPLAEAAFLAWFVRLGGRA